MKASEYEYEELESVQLPKKKEEELIAKLEKVIDGNSSIQLYKITKIAEKNEDIFFMLQWLEENKITIRGQNGTLESEFENYERTAKKLGANGDKTPFSKPKRMSDEQQKEGFRRLDELKKIIAMGQASKEEELEYDRLVIQLTEGNLRLVDHVVNTFPSIQKLQSSSFERDDEIQWGRIALNKAVETYDINRGCAFSTYAINNIYWGIYREWQKSVGIPEYVITEINKVNRVKKYFVDKNGREPTNEEIGSILGMSSERIEVLIKVKEGYFNVQYFSGLDGQEEEKEPQERDFDKRVTQIDGESFAGGIYKEKNNVISISGDGDIGLTEEGNTVLVEPDSTEDFVQAKMLREAIEKQLKTLTPREEHVIKLRFGLYDGKTRSLEEVGKDFDLTKERIRQIEAKALRKLRHPSRARHISGYVR